MKPITFALSLAAALAVATSATAAAKKELPPASKKTGLTFDKDIKPIFEKSCVECHGDKKQKGKLRLDTLANALKASENGKSIVPGKSADSSLVKAIARNEFFLVFQPTVDLRTTEVVGVEALIRWNHPTLGVLEPGRFVPLAERSDVTAVPAMGVIAEAMAAFVLADALLEKFGGDALAEVQRNLDAYLARLDERLG